ncbi:polysaccharide pyruvyl transferase family protein, partial [Tardiphaga sp.]|uniref:polysaccharide pyruvyl transferase family protein n=1 Tax=Tardiphaga sp. TaxID=1926292 RepID=UPI0037D9F6A2
MTDMDRWSNSALLSPTWAERCRFASRLVPAGLRILDVGCGTMEVERSFAPSTYYPADVVARDERTSVFDLNQDQIPRSLLNLVDIVTMLGVIEYIDELDSHLRSIASSGTRLLVSYNSKERCEHVDRASNGWVNDFTTDQLVSKLQACGFNIRSFAVYDQQQVIILAAPVECAKPENVPAIASATQTSVLSRKSIVLIGFFGRGNCGDEAILQCVYESFRSQFDVIISVDEHGAYIGFWDWYPYNEARIVHQTNIAEILNNPNIVAVLVGGGGLRVGFGANQVLAARYAARKTAIAGVDLWYPLPGHSSDATHSYASLFDFVSIRHSPASETHQTALDVHHGGDWTFRLPRDTAVDLVADPSRVLITLREYPIEQVPWDYIIEIRRIVEAVRLRDLLPAFLPFSPEDERFLMQMGLEHLAPVERHWWNPRRAKQLIASSGAMLSVGRLHPLIFAADVETPVAAINLRHISPEFEVEKIGIMASELGIAV